MRGVDLHTSFVFFGIPSWEQSHIPFYSRHFCVDDFRFPMVGYVTFLEWITSRCSFNFKIFWLCFHHAWSNMKQQIRMHDPVAFLLLVVASSQLVVSNCSSSLYVTWLPFVPRIELEEQTRMREVAELKKSLEICNWKAFCFSLPFWQSSLIVMLCESGTSMH